MWIVRTECRDVRRNLAVEEWLLDRAEAPGPVLMLWRNDRAVVIGKNQNPWREARLERLAAEGAVWARRASGGGTVYHDDGNLNFSVIVPRARHDPERPFALVRRALASLGVVSEVRNRTSLFHGDRKFSGSAFCLRGRSALHHGTVAVALDLDRMRRLLEPPSFAIETAAVPSVPAPVVNLSEIVPGLDCARVAAAVESAFEEENGPCRRVDDGEIGSWPWQAAAARHASDEWLDDATPRFEARFDGPGGRWARVRVVEGRVAETGASDDSVVAAIRTGSRFDPEAIRAILEGTA